MYLSRLDINHGKIAYGWLSQPYRVHQRLCMAAGDDPRLLFRIELPRHAQREGAYVLAQTMQAPDWPVAFDGFPVLDGEVLCKQVAYALYQGQMLTFRLRANPTTRKRLKDGSKKRIGLIKEEEQREWLRRKAEAGGFQIIHATIRQDQPLLATIKGNVKSHRNNAEHRLKLVSAQFEGILQVRDPTLMQTTLAQGIGSGKGMGFGLLSIAPARG